MFLCACAGSPNDHGEGPISPSSMYYPQEGFADSADMVAGDTVAAPQEMLNSDQTYFMQNNVVREISISFLVLVISLYSFVRSSLIKKSAVTLKRTLTRAMK